MSQRRIKPTGFTLIELLVVMTIIATLLSLVAPRYIASVDKAKEAALRTNLRLTREAIDKYRADTGRYPGSLQTLVEGRYLRDIPVDPVTDRSDTWLLAPPPEGSASGGGIYDLHSGSLEIGKNGTPYKTW